MTTDNESRKHGYIDDSAQNSASEFSIANGGSQYAIPMMEEVGALSAPAEANSNCLSPKSGHAALNNGGESPIPRASDLQGPRSDHEDLAISGSAKVDGASSKQETKRPDILWCLEVSEEGKASRKFFKDTWTWKGIYNGLPGSDPEDDEQKAIMFYHVDAKVLDKTNKSGNTSSTWRDEPVDFQLGRDAELIQRFWPAIRLESKGLIRTMEQLLDYYPDHLGDYDYYASSKDVFEEFMYYYPELKAYFNSYVQSLPRDKPLDARLDIGSCGDEEIAAVVQQHLDFGALDMGKNPCDEATAYDLAVLLRLLASMYRVNVVPTMTARLLSPEPLVKYESLWLLMRPGTLVYVQQSAFKTDNKRGHRYRPGEDDLSGEDKERSAWIVSSWSYEEGDLQAVDVYCHVDRLKIELWSIQYDGTFFQRISRDITVLRFDGSRAIKTLQIVPADIQDKADGGKLRRRLENRGRKYLTILREPAAYREYNSLRSGYNGQIIVDPETFMQHANVTYDEYVRLEPIVDGGGGHKFRDITDFSPATSETFSRVSEVYVLLPRRIEGFGLKTKRWMVFEIDNISERAPVPSPNQLENELVLVSDADKEALRTVLPKGEKPVGVSSDFVLGKGEGKVFLLYGPPGTGKTLTVECVANDTGRPLLCLTAQDVGVGIDGDTESRLREWFTLAAKWDAILLIDEADLFLEQRREGNLSNNSLSTVFLRSMEYYKGVLFLTTNRAGHIDDSFISRITCPIAYHPLSPETKAKIVKKLVRRFEGSGTIEVQQRAENYLVEHCQDLNGRQIRNVLQNAVATAEVQQRAEGLAAPNSGPMGQELRQVDVVSVKWHHVKSAVERQIEFRTYLDSLKGRDENARARSKQDYLATPPRGREN
jgi:hypothetical protein